LVASTGKVGELHVVWKVVTLILITAVAADLVAMVMMTQVSHGQSGLHSVEIVHTCLHPLHSDTSTYVQLFIIEQHHFGQFQESFPDIII